MNSKEALKEILECTKITAPVKCIQLVQQDLERLEKLEKALNKACERLEYYTGTCPVDQELIEDLDCDECDNNCKECWKKYFMKEVLEND